MLIIHAVQKLLNTSRLKASLYVSQPSKGQQMHSWYARLFSSSFTGKLFVMYVHEPSLLTIVCRGKTISGTWPEFLIRLPALMKRFDFPDAFINAEMKEAGGYVVAKTDSKSMLAYMNQMVFQLEYNCMRFPSYEVIPLDFLEDLMMDNFYQTGNKEKPYTTPKEYWQKIF